MPCFHVEYRHILGVLFVILAPSDVPQLCGWNRTYLNARELPRVRMTITTVFYFPLNIPNITQVNKRLLDICEAVSIRSGRTIHPDTSRQAFRKPFSSSLLSSLVRLPPCFLFFVSHEVLLFCLVLSPPRRCTRLLHALL